MALAQCRECAKQVSTEAPTCPHCGVPRPTASSTGLPHSDPATKLPFSAPLVSPTAGQAGEGSVAGQFCRNCGKSVRDGAEICPNCGTRPLSARTYCQACGVGTTPTQEVCMKCGKRLKTLLAEAFLRKPPPPQQEDSPKSSFFSPSEEEAKGLAKGLVVVVTWFFFGWVYALMWILGFGAKDAWRGRAKARLKPRAQVSGRFLLFLVLGLMSLSLLGIASVYLSGGPHLSVPERLASPGFRFSVGDALVNVNNGVEIGVVVRTERAHSFRNGMVDRAYIIAGPNGVEMDMVADVLERIAAPTPRVLPGPVAAAPPGPSAGRGLYGR